MVRKILGVVLLSAIFLGGVVALYFGLEIWLDGSGGRVGPVMMAAGAMFAAMGAYTLAEDFAENFLQPRSAANADPRRLQTTARSPGKPASRPD